MRKSCWARSLAAVVFVGALFFGFAEAEAVQLASGIIDYDITGLGNVEVGQDTPDVPATVDFMPASDGKTGAITQGTINVGNSGTVNIYGGLFNSEWDTTTYPSYDGWFELSVAAGSDVTFYGTSFSVGGVGIDEGTESIDLTAYPIGPLGAYSVSWTGTGVDPPTYDIWVGSNAPINLNWLGIYVDVPVDPDSVLLSYDFGDVEINGDPGAGTLVIPIYNLGDGDLTVTSVTIVGDGDFAITASPAEPIVIAPSETIGVDVEVTYTPTVEGLVSATVFIASDDADEPTVEVALTGCGIVVVSPEQQQIRDILDFYDVSAEIPALLEGDGPGNSAEKRLKALRNMIKAAGDLINLGEYELAAKQLTSVAKKTDGEKRPPDFVVGYSVATLNAMVNDLIADLTL